MNETMIIHLTIVSGCQRNNNHLSHHYIIRFLIITKLTMILKKCHYSYF